MGEEMNKNGARRTEKSDLLKKIREEAESRIKEYNKLSLEDIAKDKSLGYEIDYILHLLEGLEDED
jgi:hypothetical protein